MKSYVFRLNVVKLTVLIRTDFVRDLLGGVKISILSKVPVKRI